MAEFIWEPTPDVLADANVVRLMRRHGIDDYWELQRRSQDDPEWFWPAAIEDMGLDFWKPWERVVDLSRGPEWATWFVGGRLNVAWNCVHRFRSGPRASAPAAVFAERPVRRSSCSSSATSSTVSAATRRRPSAGSRWRSSW